MTSVVVDGNRRKIFENHQGNFHRHFAIRDEEGKRKEDDKLVQR